MNLHRDTMQCADYYFYFYFFWCPQLLSLHCALDREEKTEEVVAISQANTFCF